MEKLDPFVYSSRNEYINKNKTFGFYIILVISLFIISCPILAYLAVVTKNDFLVILFLLSAFLIPFAIIFEILDRADMMGKGFVVPFFREIKERRKMKHLNYQPLNSDGYKLNHIVKLENGKLFRLYQFIKPEKSDRRYVYYELPKGAQINYGYNDLKENSCMFKSLNDYELADILTPISQYYIDKEYREKLKKKEQYINKQSEINQHITDEEINNLPLFKGFRQIEKNIKKDIDSYNKEHENNIQSYQSLLNKTK